MPMLMRLSLWCFGLMASLPFLTAIHRLPLGSFYAEWLAALLGLTGAVFVLIGAARFAVPGVALLCCFLGSIAMLQAVTGLAVLAELATLFALYLLWAALLSIAGRRLADEFGLSALVRATAAAMLFGSLTAALGTALWQWLPLFGTGWFPPSLGGPIGQRNHLTSYIWLGIASALYLRSTQALSAVIFWAATTGLLFAVVVVGQRSSLLYLAAIVGIASWEAMRQGRTHLRRVLGVGLLFLLLHLAVLLMPPSNPRDQLATPLARTMDQAGGLQVRWQLLRLGLLGVTEAPLVGSGIGGYAKVAFDHSEQVEPVEGAGKIRFAHNLFMQLAVDLGLPAALSVLVATAFWLWRFVHRQPTPELAWVGAVVAVVGLHSMIEFPLWYSYFMGPTAIVLGASGGVSRIGGRGTATALTVIALVGGGITLGRLISDFTLLEYGVNKGALHGNASVATATLLRVPQDSLLAPWVQATACESLDPLLVAVEDGLVVCTAALAHAPFVSRTVPMVVLLWRAGREGEARDLLQRLRQANRLAPDEVEEALAPLFLREPSLDAALRR